MSNGEVVTQKECSFKYTQLKEGIAETKNTVKGNSEILQRVMQKLNNGISDKLETIKETTEKALGDVHKRMDKIERLTTQLFFSVLGLFGSLILTLIGFILYNVLIK